jgi:aconitate hydratase
LINFCIVPVEFAEPGDYERIEAGDELVIDDLLEAIKGSDEVKIAKADGSYEFVGRLGLSHRDRKILLGGGLLTIQGAAQ